MDLQVVKSNAIDTCSGSGSSFSEGTPGGAWSTGAIWEKNMNTTTLRSFAAATALLGWAATGAFAQEV
ncbi:hypothetical protein, partial [Rhizobium leguminosarum]|uniref:hypothetical protein n=1 Tax=Rhizobium leguminosarum TaxID=384 RepID=UPI001C94693B